MPTPAYVYTLPDCSACGRAKALVVGLGYELIVVPIDNPLVEMAIGMIYNDHQVHAPVVVVPDKGVYILSTDEEPRLLRAVNLEPAPPPKSALCENKYMVPK